VILHDAVPQVKVVNRGAEQRQAASEPFGQSGTRCGLFDPITEEPYPLVLSASGDTVNSFTCQIFGPREGGRYNLSVAILGQVGPRRPRFETAADV
jgi:hypothetical protein